MALKCDRSPDSYLGSMHNYPIMLCISSENYSYTSSINNYINTTILLKRARKLKKKLLL